MMAIKEMCSVIAILNELNEIKNLKRFFMFCNQTNGITYNFLKYIAVLRMLGFILIGIAQQFARASML